MNTNRTVLKTKYDSFINGVAFSKDGNKVRIYFKIYTIFLYIHEYKFEFRIYEILYYFNGNFHYILGSKLSDITYLLIQRRKKYFFYMIFNINPNICFVKDKIY